PSDRAVDRPARFSAPGSGPPARHPRPARSRLRAGRGHRSPRARAPAAATLSLGHSGQLGEKGSDLKPLVDRLAAGPGSGGKLPSQLDRAIPRLHVADEPARGEVLGLRERAIGQPRGAPPAPTPRPAPPGPRVG